MELIKAQHSANHQSVIITLVFTLFNINIHESKLHKILGGIIYVEYTYSRKVSEEVGRNG